MARIDLSAPVAINPAQSRKLGLKSARVDLSGGKTVLVDFDMIDDAGEVIGARQERLSGPAFVALADALIDLIVSDVPAKMGVTGTKEDPRIAVAEAAKLGG